MTTLQNILDAVQALPAADRVQLFYTLWDTVSPEDWVPPSTDWIEEADRRSAEFDAGRMSAAPWSEVRERARRRAGIDD